ncbi:MULTISPECIES: hypothetical protein [unclassified Bradyrhizobium]|uniref:hypothetical protein n=1 Tax=unclassified Bradyrhizobium TaxID=2631580 RepID=UPI002916BDF3|nr:MULTISPECIES: hypothetical protein [unclassified Bradyrhizobium]
MDIIDPPPSSWKISREAWAATPEVVRAEALRAVAELARGFERYRPAAERDADLAEFHAIAAAGGTTVKQALRNYIGMENMLRSDPEAGIVALCHHMDLDPVDLATAVINEEVA